MEFNIADLLECVADAVPEREAVVCRERPPHVRRARRAARPGSRTRCATPASASATTSACYLRNSVEHLEVMLACYKARAVPINVNYRYVAEELQYLCDDADLVALFHDADTAEHVAAVHSPLVRLDDDRRLAGVRSPRGVRRRRTRPRPRSPDDRYVALHGRHDRPAQGRGVAAGGHVLRRTRQREPGRSADHRARADPRVGARQPRPAPPAVPPRPATPSSSSCRSRSGR